MPTAGATWIARPALTGRILEHLDAGALVLEAGAGYGKTAALRAAVESTGATPAWVSCTQVDRDPARLLARVAAAVDDALPGSAAVMGERLATATETVDVLALTADLLRELGATLVERVVVLLDDAEALAGSPDALEVVSRLIESDVAGLRVAVASRRPLDLRTAKLRAAGRLATIPAAELAFDSAECDQLLWATHGRSPEEGEVERLMAATEGWPLGLALAVAARTTAAPRSPSSAPTEVAAFVAEELLNPLDPALRAAIEDSSVLSELDPDALRALDLPPDLPDRAQEAGIPLSPSGRPGGSLRHHPLVREILRGRLDAQRPAAELRSLLERAAGVARERGRAAEAIELLLDGGSALAAASAIAEAGPSLALTSWRTVSGWIERLPESERSSPRVKLLAGQVALAGGDQPLGDALLKEVEDALADHDPASTWFARLLRSRALHEVGRWDELVAAAEPFEEAAVAEAGPPAAMVALYAAAVLTATGRIDEGSALAARGLDNPLRDLLAPADLPRRLYELVPAGRVAEARAASESVVAALEQADPMGILPTATASLAMVLTYAGDLDDAIVAWERTSRAVERLGSHRAIAVCAHLARASLLAQLGRSAQASQAMAHAEPVPDLGFRTAWAHGARANLAWCRGDRAAALAAAEAAIAAASAAPAPGDWIWTTSEVAPVLAAAGDRPRALAAVDDALDFLDSRLPGDAGRFWRACLLAERAGFRHDLGDRSGADLDVAAFVAQAGTATHDVLRRSWPRVGAAVQGALERGAVDAAPVVDAVARARPDGAVAVKLLEHPRRAVRIAAAGVVAVSGHPHAAVKLAAAAADADAAVAAAGAHALERLAAEPLRLKVQMLGGFAVTRGAWVVERGEWRRPVASALFRYLVIHGTAHQDDLLDAFWPGRPEAGARRGLEVALSLVRGVVDSPGRAQSGVEKTGLTYRLQLAPGDRVDADEFRSAARTALAERDPSRRLALLEAAAAAWTGPPLPEDRNSHLYVTWRESLEELHVEVLAQICDERLRAGDGLGAVEAGRRLVDADPHNEAAHRRLMIAHARAGRRGSALHQYLVCRRVLVAEFGVEPAAETKDLHARILAGAAV